MIEIAADMFALAEDPLVDALVVTTNGFVKRDGRLVMGRGCARTADELWDVGGILGGLVGSGGNRVHVAVEVEHGPRSGLSVVSFPVKPARGTTAVRRHEGKFPPGDVPGWACVADPAIIRASASELRGEADARGWRRVVMPRPGCGYGELRWADVRPLLEPLLDDRFVVCRHAGSPD